MSKPIIQVRNLSKKYILGERQPYYSLRDTISNIAHLPFKKEKLQKDEFWALKDVSFDINQGDVVGVIGRNGAGKSTLLKILSQITPPTEGEVKLRGRVASLLEVGTGFHPELTGRENIYLNGAILGMKRWEINKKFDEIVEFAEIEKFLDTPVKHYSSGMYMKLAFSVAAHLEPEILLVDEVLAVGDAQFQKKSLGKMQEVSKQGRTIVFVSHNLSAISRLCKKVILLENGKIANIGKTNTTINFYLNTNKLGKKTKLKVNEAITSLELIPNSENTNFWKISYGQPIIFSVEFELSKNILNFEMGIGINTVSGDRLITVHSEQKSLKTGKYIIKYEIENMFTPGNYSLSIGARNNFYLPEFLDFEVVNTVGKEAHKQYNYGPISGKAKIKFLDV